LRVCPMATFRFTGHQDILEKMKEYFNMDVGRCHIFFLYGLGGAGKSQIAFKFVEMSTFPESRFSEIYFIDSSTQKTLENDLATVALAKQIGKTAEDSLLWLSHQHIEWLIVFNNADDIHLNLVKFFPSGSHGNILITSHNPDLGQHAQVEHKVDHMECEDSIDLLLATARYSKTAETTEIATQIKLHCLPLAVAQAGAYISSSRALHKYLLLYENTVKRIQLLNQSPQKSEYEWSVYATWQMSFEKLSNQAVQLLQLCSFIHHDGIPEEIFEQASLYELITDGPTQEDLCQPSEFLASFLNNSTWDSMKFMAIADELGRYSLIQFESTSRGGMFSIHPLVHEWCHTTVKSEDASEVCMHKLMGMSISSADFMFKHRTFPHLHALLFGHPNTLLAMANLATIYSALGHYKRAEEFEMVVVNKRCETFGKNHPDTLRAMANLACTYSKLGQFSQAAELTLIVLNKRREIFQKDHPDILRAMVNLAATFSHLGRFSEAKELETIVLNKRSKLFGEYHPDTLWAMANLAYTYTAQGDHKGAEQLQKTVHRKLREILGEDHPDTLRAMGNLAQMYAQLGQFRQAEELETTVLDKYRRI
ncbi:P-loop containing nucleoside triphosphate hydrolase protein, partial [Mycena epipterygia]